MKSSCRHLFMIAIAIVFSALIAHESNAQPLIASYPLLNNQNDVTGNYSTVGLYGNPTPAAAPNGDGNGVCLNGIYINDAGGQNLLTPTFTTLNYQNFQMDVDFKLNTVSAFLQPVIIGGMNTRWIGIYVESDGKVGVLHDNMNYT